MRFVLLASCSIVAASSSMAQDAASGPPSPVILFFDWGKPDIRSDDRALLDEVANRYRAQPTAHLTIAGHTDRSGGLSFNRTAGLKRALTVQAELERRGVPRNAMSTVSFGEDRPLVPTEDGVREVQNRRVVIAFEE